MKNKNNVIDLIHIVNARLPTGKKKVTQGTREPFYSVACNLSCVSYFVLAVNISVNNIWNMKYFTD